MKTWILPFIPFSFALVLAQEPATDTAAARQFFAWLEVFNRGDRAAIRQFLEKNFPEGASHVDQELEFRNRTGGFDLKTVEESAPTRFAALVKERGSDRFARVIVEVEPAEPHGIRNLRLQLVPRPPEFAPKRMGEKDALAALRAVLEERAAAGRFSGAVLVARNGKPIFEQAYGLADREHKTPNRVDTKFRIGSMNKMFTGVAVAQLAQAGKLRFTDTLDKYVPEYPNHEVASKVTIEQLLTHTGGTGDIFGPEFDANRDKLRELKDYVALYGKRAPDFAPGSRWAYSNYGYILLGLIIEHVAGMSYYDYVRSHIFKPAGMLATDSLPETEYVPNRSIGYMRRGGGELRPNTATLPWRGTSAGGGYSTAGDLLRFANALLGNKLLNAEYSALVMTGKVDAPNGKYGYGFMDSRSGNRLVGHSGGAPGMNAELNIYPDSGYIVIALANLDPPAAGAVAEFIGDRLPAGK